jgi:hypothetical protein
MQKQKLNKITHLHWKNLINHPKVEKICNQGEVFQIQIKPLSPPEPGYDYMACLQEEGVKAGSVLKHQTNCVWE